MERRLSASAERFWERWCRREAKREGREEDWEAGVERVSWDRGEGGVSCGDANADAAGVARFVGFEADVVAPECVEGIAGLLLVGVSTGFRCPSSSYRRAEVVIVRRANTKPVVLSCCHLLPTCSPVRLNLLLQSSQVHGAAALLFPAASFANLATAPCWRPSKFLGASRARIAPYLITGCITPKANESNTASEKGHSQKVKAEELSRARTCKAPRDMQVISREAWQRMNLNWAMMFGGSAVFCLVLIGRAGTKR